MYSVAISTGCCPLPCVASICNDILQLRFSQAKVRDKPLQLGIFLFEWAQSLDFGRHQPGVPRVPVIERCFRYTGLAAHLPDRGADLSLLHDEANLRLRTEGQRSENFDFFFGTRRLSVDGS